MEYRNDALQVPVQAVFERGGKTFCLVKKGAGWDTREIAISSTNAKTVALDEEASEPLREGEVVVINPRQHVAKFDASKLPAPTNTPPRPAVAAAKSAAAAAAKQPDGRVAQQPGTAPTDPSGANVRRADGGSTAPAIRCGSRR